MEYRRLLGLRVSWATKTAISLVWIAARADLGRSPEADVVVLLLPTDTASQCRLVSVAEAALASDPAAASPDLRVPHWITRLGFARALTGTSGGLFAFSTKHSSADERSSEREEPLSGLFSTFAASDSLSSASPAGLSGGSAYLPCRWSFVLLALCALRTSIVPSSRSWGIRVFTDLQAA